MNQTIHSLIKDDMRVRTSCQFVGGLLCAVAGVVLALVAATLEAPAQRTSTRLAQADK